MAGSLVVMISVTITFDAGGINLKSLKLTVPGESSALMSLVDQFSAVLVLLALRIGFF